MVCLTLPGLPIHTGHPRLEQVKIHINPLSAIGGIGGGVGNMSLAYAKLIKELPAIESTVVSDLRA